MPRQRYCAKCDCPLEFSQEPDEMLEAWCPDERDCEHEKCGYRSCGEDRPEPCAQCGLDFCPKHLNTVGDAKVCFDCMKELWLIAGGKS